MTDYSLLTLKRVVAGRCWVLLGIIPVIWWVPPMLEIAWPLAVRVWLTLLLIPGCLLAWITVRRFQQGESIGAAALMRQMMFDILTLGFLIFFTGGVTNPLISLLLPPVAIAALLLPPKQVWPVALLSLLVYSILMEFYQPLVIADAARATQLHLMGMWLTFTVSVLTVSGFIVTVVQQLREHERRLAAAREQAVRNERITALGTLAAGAAHELGTPLSSIQLIADDLQDLPELPAEAREDLHLLKSQVQACKAIITRLSRRAGASRCDEQMVLPIGDWLQSCLSGWQALHAQVHVHYAPNAPHEPLPEVRIDARLEQSVHNLLNNAAQAGSRRIEVTLDFDGAMFTLCLHDDGPGFPAQVLQAAGRQAMAPSAHGQGLGLWLTLSAMEQMGGSLAVANDDHHHGRVTLRFPCRRSSPHSSPSLPFSNS